MKDVLLPVDAEPGVELAMRAAVERLVIPSKSPKPAICEADFCSLENLRSGHARMKIEQFELENAG